MSFRKIHAHVVEEKYDDLLRKKNIFFFFVMINFEVKIIFCEILLSFVFHIHEKKLTVQSLKVGQREYHK